MKNRRMYLFCLASVALMVPRAGLGIGDSSNSNTPIRVLLERSSGPVTVRGMKEAAVSIDGVVRGARLSAGMLYLEARKSGDVSMVRIPYRPRIAKEIELLWPLGSPGLEMNGKAFRGRIRFVSRSNELFVVNTLPLEVYLASTIGAEMSPSWPLEALKAQAIAARTYAMYRLNQPRHELHDIDATTQDQVYSGIAGESPSTWTAVRETLGTFLAENVAPLKVHFHSRCGGQTQSARKVWGGTDARDAEVDCPYCRRNPYRWRASWNRAEFATRLGLPTGSDFSIVNPMYDLKGRIQRVEVGVNGFRHSLTAEQARRGLGYTNLKSNRFALSRTGERIFAQGIGAGHGVGMCQWGAKYLAENGKPAVAILAHYYPSLKLRHRAFAPQKSVETQRVAGLWSRRNAARPARF